MFGLKKMLFMWVKTLVAFYYYHHKILFVQEISLITLKTDDRFFSSFHKESDLSNFRSENFMVFMTL